MSSLLNTTASVQHVSPLPPGTGPAKGVAMLHKHDVFIQCNPHMIKYEAINTPTNPEPQLPSHGALTGIAPPKCYLVTDKVHTLPAGLWDSDVVSTVECINLDKGLFVRVRSPLNCILENTWTVQEKSDGSGHELKQDTVIKCSRLLVGIIRSTCESSWRDLHGNILERIQQES
ncbi:hypothetical protein E4U54_000031 [Claviceps lovelessii]|nr:hypothetical protein E4U54_000031 [Claviceps lovelessii]